MKKFLTFFAQHRWLTFFLACMWTLMIWIGCTMKGSSLPHVNLFPNFDKLVHFIFFGGFFLLWALCFKRFNQAEVFIFIFAILYGLGIEYYQLYFVPGRSYDLLDVAADAVGAGGAWILLKRFQLHK